MDTPAPDRPADLGGIAARGVAVTFLTQGGRALLQFGSVAILARLLVPEEFGLVAMVAAFVGAAEVLRDFGLSTAAIQSPTLTDDERTNLFWANAAAGLGCSLLALAATPLLVLLYDEPRLVEINLVIAPLFLINGMATQFRAGLARDLQFKALGLSDLVAQLLSASVSVGLALAGAGVWALVTGMLVNSALTGVFYASRSRWLPGLPRRSVSIRRFFNFGAGVFGTQMVGYVVKNVDNVSVGVASGATALGLYGRAYQLMTVPLTQINAPMGNIVLPVLRHTQSDDEAFTRYLGKAQLVLLYAAGGIFAVMSGLAEPIVLILFGDRWTGVVPILAVLAMAGVFRTLVAVPWWTYLARGHSGALFRQRLATGVMSVSFILGGLPWGPVGVAWGVAIGSALAWFIGMWDAGRVARVPTRPLVTRALLTIAVVNVPCGVAAHAATWLPAPAVLQLLAGVVAAAAYLLVARLVFPLVRHDMEVVVTFARRALPDRKRAVTPPSR
jgi:O-antigen/teichoic acid export membrane protein